ncbi:MAG: YjcQ family protein [Clostridia bacterium]
MDNFKIMYKILKTLEASMDLEQVNQDSVSYTKLGITEERYNRILKMLLKKGYIDGIKVQQYIDGETIINTENIEITIEGLQFLEENGLMKKIHNTAKGIKEITPFI